MIYFLILFSTLLVLSGLIAFAWAFFATRGQIKGKFTRDRILPTQMKARLRERRRRAVGIVLISAVVLAAICWLLHDLLFATDIELAIERNLVLYGLFYDSLSPLEDLFGIHLPVGIQHLIIYGALATSLACGAWIGISLGLRRACESFLLTRSFSRGRHTKPTAA